MNWLSLVGTFLCNQVQNCWSLKSEFIHVQWNNDRSMATATCSGPSSCWAPPSTRGRECFGQCCIWYCPTGRPCFTAASAQPACTAAPVASSAASAAGGKWRWPQMWCVWPWYFTLGQSPWAPVHGKPGPFVPVHSVHEDLQPSNGSSRASVCSGWAEAICVWCVQNGILPSHVFGTTS